MPKGCEPATKLGDIASFAMRGGGACTSSGISEGAVAKCHAEKANWHLREGSAPKSELDVEQPRLRGVVSHAGAWLTLFGYASSCKLCQAERKSLQDVW
ncbi:protein of unknown function (plasmid) [Cupriavidus taiwanensis]|uniref:Uncharacterized protein n=1 Tax=Cupriavidus taiwanensis TaxID=164546 RepID=A0A375IMR5_9BURK|nr:protein of unknown function [Cupriavidus taiwanensis]